MTTAYPVTIYYSKRFDSGILRGLTVNDSAGFDTVERAVKAYHVGRTGRDSITGTRYTITDASFQKYDRR